MHSPVGNKALRSLRWHPLQAEGPACLSFSGKTIHAHMYIFSGATEELKHHGAHRRGTRGCAAHHDSSCRWPTAAVPAASRATRAKLMRLQPWSIAETIAETTWLWFISQERLVQLFQIRLSSAAELDGTWIFPCSRLSEDGRPRRHSSGSGARWMDADGCTPRTGQKLSGQIPDHRVSQPD